MKKWIVKFSELETVTILKEMDIISYLPTFYKGVRFLVVETDMPKEEIQNISGVVSVREERTGTLNV